MPKILCLDCGRLIDKPPGGSKQGGRCPECKRTHQRERDAKRGSAAERGYDADWRAVRSLVLARDRHTCRYCHRTAKTVDHVVPLAEGGARLDPNNLVACCLRCNSKRGGATRRPGGVGGHVSGHCSRSTSDPFVTRQETCTGSGVQGGQQ